MAGAAGRMSGKERMVLSYGHSRQPGRALFLASHVCRGVPSGTIKLAYTGPAMDGNVWPLSPGDGTTG